MQEGAHDRSRSWELRHWSSVNAHSYKRDKKAGVRLREDGEVELRGSGRADYYHPK